MRFRNLIFISLAALTPTLSRAEILSFVGADSSGGGKVVACRNPEGSLRSVELLDLFEARALYGLEPAAERASVEDYLAEAKLKLEGIFKDAHNIMNPYVVIADARSQMRLLPEGTKLKPLDDANEIALPNGCNPEQLAVYRDNALLLVDRELWDALDARNKAALFVHEGIYRWDRETGEGAQNSIYARKITGHLFSQFEFEPILEGIPKGASSCIVRSKKDPSSHSLLYGFYFYESKTDAGLAVLQFTYIRGKIPYSKTFANLGMPQFDGAVSQYSLMQSKLETLPGISTSWNSNQEMLRGIFEVNEKDEGALKVICQPSGN